MEKLETYDITGLEINRKKLSTDIKDSGCIDTYASLAKNGNSLQVWGGSIIDKPTLDLIIEDHEPYALDAYQANKNDMQIDKKTSELILAGFTYKGVLLPCSKNAQTNAQSLYADIGSPYQQPLYPIPVSSLDNLSNIELVDDADVGGYYWALKGHKASAIISGTNLKIAINAATDIAGVDAVIDTR